MEQRQPHEQSAPEGHREELVGEVEVVTYHDDQSQYTVLRIAPEEGYDDPQAPSLWRSLRLSAVGAMVQPAAGQRLRLTGRWTTHKSHGRQFAFDSAEILPPASVEGAARYLASGVFEGIGETLARRIVDKLGPGAIEVIHAHPEQLEGIAGLRSAVRAKLIEAVRAQFTRHKLHGFLRGVGLGPRQSAAVALKLGADAEERIRANPYELAGAVAGIGFVIADRIARELGFAPDSLHRCRAALLHSLRSAADEGHSLLGEEALRSRTADLLRLEPERLPLTEALEQLADAEEVTLEHGLLEGERAVYLPHLAACERGLAANLARLLTGGPRTPLATEADLERFERRSGFELDSDQRRAVLGLLQTPLALLTGGPGVGKTTIVRCLVALAEAAGARVKLASPTGRAAKRLTEATERQASTLHRLLLYDPQTRAFTHNQDRPLQADLLVVDETSMLDVVIAHHTFKAIDTATRVVLVGDPDQLPSVAPGNVLVELMRSQRAPVFRLTQIHRQGRNSRIVENAHRILRGEMPVFPSRGEPPSDCYFFPAEDALRCAERTVEVVTQRIPRSFGFDWVQSVQVLAPMYRGECGVDALNERLRAALGAGGPEFRAGERSWRVGDRVIHTRNDYDKEVFNGDMGRVVSVSEEGLNVAYPERTVAYAPDELGDLQPAFAVTVHRSQGSEYDVVVLPVVPQHHLMLQRNLLYTAVTRARKLLVLVGAAAAIRRAVENAEQGLRLARLERRLVQLLPETHAPLRSWAPPAT